MLICVLKEKFGARVVQNVEEQGIIKIVIHPFTKQEHVRVQFCQTLCRAHIVGFGNTKGSRYLFPHQLQQVTDYKEKVLGA
jgi:hypothetical protein